MLIVEGWVVIILQVSHRNSSQALVRVPQSFMSGSSSAEGLAWLSCSQWRALLYSCHVDCLIPLLMHIDRAITIGTLSEGLVTSEPAAEHAWSQQTVHCTVANTNIWEKSEGFDITLHYVWIYSYDDVSCWMILSFLSGQENLISWCAFLASRILANMSLIDWTRTFCLCIDG